MILRNLAGEHHVKDLWEQHAARELRALVRSAGVTYADLAQALVAEGETLTPASLAKKVYRGSFSFSFYLKCRAAVQEIVASQAGVPPFQPLLEEPRRDSSARAR